MHTREVLFFIFPLLLYCYPPCPSVCHGRMLRRRKDVRGQRHAILHREAVNRGGTRHASKPHLRSGDIGVEEGEEEVVKIEEIDLEIAHRLRLDTLLKHRRVEVEGRVGGDVRDPPLTPPDIIVCAKGGRPRAVVALPIGGCVAGGARVEQEGFAV